MKIIITLYTLIIVNQVTKIQFYHIQIIKVLIIVRQFIQITFLLLSFIQKKLVKLV